MKKAILLIFLVFSLSGLLETPYVFAEPCPNPIPADKKDCNWNCISKTDVCLMMPLTDEKNITVNKDSTTFRIIAEYVGMFYNWWSVVVGLLAVLMIVVGGVQYMMYGADPGQKDDAKSRITQALLALTLLLLSGLILHTINPIFFTAW